MAGENVYEATSVIIECQSVQKIVYGDNQGKYVYKFWEENGDITVDELIIVDQRSDLFCPGNSYVLTMSMVLPA